MKKFGLYIVLSVILLLNSCECLDDSVQSRIHFEDPGALGITHATMSGLRDRIQGTTPRISEFESGALVKSRRLSGPEMLRIHYGAYERQFMLFLNDNDEIVVTWDLADTTQRWADEANWYVDSSICKVCGESRDQLRFFNHYTFSDLDVL